jgi:hypothetical protein
VHFCSILSTKRAKINVNMVASRIFAATDAALKGAAMSWHSLSSKCSPVVAWLVVAACSIGDGGLHPVCAESGWVPGERMRQALVRVMSSTRRVTENTKFGLLVDVPCFTGAFQEEGRYVSNRISLVKGVQYAIVGGGDDGVKDLDLHVYNDNGDVVAQDVDADAFPVVTFTPRKSGYYIIRMTLASAAGWGSFCCYAMFNDEGYDVPIVNLATATVNMLTYGSSLKEIYGEAFFHAEPGQSCLYGMLLPEHGASQQSGFTFNSKGHVFVAGADHNADDIDLTVLDSKGNVVDMDVDEDASPIVFSASRGDHSFVIKNARSSGVTLCIVAAFSIRSP